MSKKPVAKKRAPADITIRNARASLKRDTALNLRVGAVENRIEVIEKRLSLLEPPPEAA